MEAAARAAAEAEEAAVLAALVAGEREERINALEVLLVLALFCQPESGERGGGEGGDSAADHVGQVKLAFTMFDSDLSGTMSMVRGVVLGGGRTRVCWGCNGRE